MFERYQLRPMEQALQLHSLEQHTHVNQGVTHEEISNIIEQEMSL